MNIIFLFWLRWLFAVRFHMGMLWKLLKIGVVLDATHDLTAVDPKELELVLAWSDDLTVPLEWSNRCWMMLYTEFLLAVGQEREANEIKEFYEQKLERAKAKRKKLK